MKQTPQSSEASHAAKQLHMQLSIVVKDSADLLSTLHVPRQRPKHFAQPYDQALAKKYFLSKCLGDVQTMVGSQMRLLDFMQGEVARPSASEGARAVVSASINTELGLWRRRLGEVLARLVLFSTTDTGAHYYHYLLLHDAEQNARHVRNLKEDFGVVSATFKRRGEELRKKIDGLQIPDPVWYKQGKARAATADSVIRAAIAKAVPVEKTALGYSFMHSFTAPSGMIHFSTTVERARSDLAEIRFASSALFLLATAINTRVARLAGLNGGYAFDQSPVERRHRHPVARDFVVVTLDDDSIYLGEVISVASATDPITSMRIQFIGDSPYTDIQEDSFSSDYVHPFLQRADLEKALLDELAGKLVVTPQELADATRQSAEQAWKDAIRDWYHQQLKAAVEREDEKSETWYRANSSEEPRAQ